MPSDKKYAGASEFQWNDTMTREEKNAQRAKRIVFEKIRKERALRKREYLERKKIRDEIFAQKKVEREEKRLKREQEKEERRLKKVAYQALKDAEKEAKGEAEDLEKEILDTNVETLEEPPVVEDDKE